MIKQFRVRVLVTCEVCGHEIFGRPIKAIIGKAKMIVCRECADLGSASWEVQPKSQRGPRKPVMLPSKASTTKASAPSISEDLELAENFGSRVRAARREAGLSHEDLGRKVKEKISVLRKIETGKMTPNHLLARKLEHVLKVKLLVQPSEPKVSRTHLSTPHEVTLGDIVRLKKEKSEDTEKRERS